jgi:hypothetical protein
MNITPTFAKKILYRLIDLKISMVADKGIECTKAICPNYYFLYSHKYKLPFHLRQKCKGVVYSVTRLE